MARRCIDCLVWLGIAWIVLRTWMLEGLVVPVRVAGPSMASTYFGPHLDVACDDCGFSFAFDAQRLPSRAATCPNCGYDQIRFQHSPVGQGDRLLVDKATYNLRRPRRWEPVVFRCPQTSQQLCIKRVVGLPGETVSIRDGDVFINGTRTAKTLAQLRAMSVLVHDSRFQSAMSENLPSRWVTDGSSSQWTSQGAGFRFASAGEQTDAASQTTPEPDWLSYRHWRRHNLDSSQVAFTRVNDDYAYNQAMSRVLNSVNDLLLVVEVRASGKGFLFFRATTEADRFLARLRPSVGSGQLYRNGRLVAQFDNEGNFLTGREVIEWSVVDGNCYLAIGGQLLLQSSQQSEQESDRATRGVATAEISRPFAIGAEGMEVLLANLKVFRDVYYIPAPGPNGRPPDSQVLLKEGEYYVLGDNSPMSRDSRFAGPKRLIEAKAVVGRPLN